MACGFFYISCQRELPVFKNSNVDEITKAHQWLDNHILTESILPIFDDVIYHWDKASSFTFKNGYKAITIPINEINEDPLYQGQRILYLYPWKNGKGYYATIFELLPTAQHQQRNKGKIDLRTFDGFINTWDLKRGFIRGASFENGIPQKNIKVEIHSDKPMASKKRGEILSEVIVYWSGPSGNIYWFFVMNGLLYSTPYLWDGGGGGNPCEYSPCLGDDENPADYFDPKSLDEIKTPCNYSEAEALSLLSEIYGTPLNNTGSSVGASYIDENQMIRAPKTFFNDFWEMHFILGFRATYTAYFNGEIYKENASDPTWKWLSASYINSHQSKGQEPPCVDVIINVSGSTFISNDKKWVTGTSTGNLIVEITCLQNAKTKTIPVSGYVHEPASN